MYLNQTKKKAFIYPYKIIVKNILKNLSLMLQTLAYLGFNFRKNIHVRATLLFILVN